MSNSNLIQAVHGNDGFTLDFCLSQDDLDVLRMLIRSQWLYRIQLLAPRHIKQFDEYGITRYHELAHLIDHANAWPTHARVLSRESAHIVKQLPFFKNLVAEFGSVELGDEQDLGWDNVYWRLVRPGSDDTGSLHADRWFWDLMEYGNKVPSYPFERLKMWIAIYTEPGKNGLLVVPSSHLKKDWKWHEEVRYNQRKPVIDEPAENLNITLLPTEAGRAVIFHDDLLHGGSANLATSTRVSVEFSIFIPLRDKKVVGQHTHPAGVAV